MRLLLVEDDNLLRTLLAGRLRAEGFAVDEADNGERGAWLARTIAYDLLILDYCLPRLDGLEIIRSVRTDGLSMPILMLTVKEAAGDKVACLDNGSDDYLTKPFSQDELLARVRALLRRPQTLLADYLESGGLKLDTRKRRAWSRDREMILTRKEFGLLEYLMRGQGRTVSREELLEHVWDMNIDPFSNTIDAHILNLRKKIGRRQGQQAIETVPGIGYRLHS